jgi:hypothetical protein
VKLVPYHQVVVPVNLPQIPQEEEHVIVLEDKQLVKNIISRF